LSLPNELLAKILFDVDDEVDRFCLGLTCLQLFTLAEEQWLAHITNAYKVRPKLLCIGDSADWDCLPPSCTSILQDLQSTKKVGRMYWDERPHTIVDALKKLPERPNESLLNTLRRRLGLTVWRRVLLQAPVKERGMYDALFHKGSAAWRSRTPAFPGIPEARIIHASLFDDSWSLEESFAEHEIGRHYVLRNHTKKTFVLEDPFITSFAECIDQKAEGYDRFPSMELQHIALAQCCRSSSSRFHIDEGLAEELANGPWAGDELDIVSERAFRMSFRGGGEDPHVWKNDGARLLDLMWRIVLSENMLNHHHRGEHEALKASIRSRVVPGKTIEELLGGVSASEDAAEEEKEQKRLKPFRFQTREEYL